MKNEEIERILNTDAEQTVIYNYNSKENYGEAKILGGRPTGIMNFNETPHQWAVTMFDNMHARDWSPNRISMEQDAINYPLLTPVEKRAFDLVLAQLITNDSVQTQQLAIGIDKYITSPVVNCCLVRQMFEESLHSRSYTVMAEDVCKNTAEIYRLHENNNELYNKNKAVADMYSRIYEDKKGDKIYYKDVILAFVANQILEELVLPGGFAVMYSMEEKMKGTAEMIGEIHKDESNSHVPLFKRIFRTAMKELFDGIVPQQIIEPALDMIKIMAEAEMHWTKYISNVNGQWVNEISEVPVDLRTSTLKGFSSEVIDIFVKNQANSVCRNLNLPELYPEAKDQANPLGHLLKKHLSYGREGVFTGNGLEYAQSTNVGF